MIKCNAGERCPLWLDKAEHLFCEAKCKQIPPSAPHMSGHFYWHGYSKGGVYCLYGICTKNQNFCRFCWQLPLSVDIVFVKYIIIYVYAYE